MPSITVNLRHVALLVVLFGLTASARAQNGSKPPNIVIILADDMGYGDLGCYGHPRFKTPRIDQLAAQGVRMTQFNTPMPFCAPTRASLLTGRYPHRCNMTNNPAPDGGPKADAVFLPLSEITLAQLLRRAGYAAGMVGKWHLGHQRPEVMPTGRGFDEYLGILYSNDMRPVQLMQGDKKIEYPVVQANLTERYTDWACSFMEKNRGRPFLLYFAHLMPHKPLAASEGLYKKSGAGLYGDVMTEIDKSVGRVLDKLKELGLDENTIVIFTSDNGPWYGGSSGGLRGMKGTTWEGGYRVPCLVRWPGHVPAGKTNGELAVMMDLFATATAAAGVTPPKDVVIDGKNLLPVLQGKEKSGHEYLLALQGNKLASVRDARWKLHLITAKDRKDKKVEGRWIDPRGPDGVTIIAPFEQYQPSDYPGLRTGDETKAFSLFDLVNDPGEQRDVAAANADVVNRLRARAEQEMKAFPGLK